MQEHTRVVYTVCNLWNKYIRLVILLVYTTAMLLLSFGVLSSVDNTLSWQQMLVGNTMVGNAFGLHEIGAPRRTPAYSPGTISHQVVNPSSVLDPDCTNFALTYNMIVHHKLLCLTMFKVDRDRNAAAVLNT